MFIIRFSQKVKGQDGLSSQSVSSWAMRLVELGGAIFVSLFLLLSTNPAIVATATNSSGIATQSLETHEKETKPQNNLNKWKDKSAIIIYHLPGQTILTKNVRGAFTVQFLGSAEAKFVKKVRKAYGKIITEELDILCKLSKRIGRAKLKHMKHKMKNHRGRGLLTRFFLSLNFLKFWTHRQNQIALKKIRFLAKNCLNQTKPMNLNFKSVSF